MGLARPRRIASTPAMNVVETAPIPTRRTPSLPLGSEIGSPFFNMVHSPLRSVVDSGDWRKGYGAGVEISCAILPYVVAGLLCGLWIADCGLRIDKTFNLDFEAAVE